MTPKEYLSVTFAGLSLLWLNRQDRGAGLMFGYMTLFRREKKIPIHVIKRQHDGVTNWLISVDPERWGDYKRAVRFDGRGSARRTALAIKLSGDWSIDVAGPPATYQSGGTPRPTALDEI